MKKKIIYTLVTPIVLYLVYFVGILIYGTVTDFQPEDKIVLETSNKAGVIQQSDTLNLLCWNLGYAGLGAKSNFFLDGGEMIEPEEADFRNYMKGISDFISKNNSSDFILLQEVDTDSKRSYHTNMFEEIGTTLPKHKGVFTENFKVDFIPVPKTSFSPMGKVVAGLANYSKFQSVESVRYQYPGSYDWPKRVFHLDRCLLLQRFKVSNSKELVVINSHNSAFDGGVLKPQEMKMLKSMVEEEYKKGNYVIVGADWNQCPPNFNFKYFMPNKDTDYVQTNVPENYMPKDWQWAYDNRTPSNRKVDKAYKKGETFTTLIDFYLVSPNIELIEVKTENLDFAFSDHQPVKMRVKLKSLVITSKIDSIAPVPPAPPIEIPSIENPRCQEPIYCDPPGEVWEESKKETVPSTISFIKVETKPIFPGCENEITREFKSKCLISSINSHVDKHLNTDLTNELGLDSGKYRIMVQFKINEKGSITNIRVNAPHPRLKKEAIRIIKKLPKMIPAKDKGRPVTVKYVLPINFIVE